MTSTGGGDPVSRFPLPGRGEWGVLLRGANAPRSSTPRKEKEPSRSVAGSRSYGKEWGPAPGGTLKKEPRGATRIPTPLGKGREAYPGARGAGARARDSSPDPAPPRKPRGGRGVEAVPLCATTRAGAVA